MSLTVGIPIYPTFDTLDVLGPLQAFFYAGFQCRIVAARLDGVESLEKVTLLPQATFGARTQYDILFVPGGSDIPSVLIGDGKTPNAYLEFLKRQAKRAQLVCSVCTGALLLAGAGLLDGHTVTTHWAYKDVLRLFPCKVVDDYRRYVQSGKVITGAGISSGIDEALYIIAKKVGIETARMAQLSMQYHPQPIINCGDPAEPDIRDIPDLPATIQSSWQVAETKKQIAFWLGKKN